MKIIYILSSSRGVGGASKSFLNLARGVKALGNDVLVVLPDNKGLYELLSKEGFEVSAFRYEFDRIPNIIKFRDLIMFFPRLARTKIRNYKAAKRLEGICRTFCPDIIHSNVSPITIGIKPARKLGIAHIFHIREYGDKDFEIKIPGFGKKLKHSHSISITKDIAAYRNVLNRSGHTVIYNGILSTDAIRFNPNKERFFFYAGRLTRLKGVADLIEAYLLYAKTVSDPIPIYLAGRAPDDTEAAMVVELKRRIDTAGLSEKVIWLGEIENVSDYMFRATATIVPSHFEGFGRVLAEAMFNGSLTIGRNTAGTKEQFDNGVNLAGREIGFRFNNTEELAKAMNKIDSQGIESFYDLIQESQKVVESLYSTEQNVAKTIGFYNEIIKK